MATPRTKTSDYLSGHAVLKWSPKLDFTDQTQVYLSLSHGARPGGFNPPSFSGLFKDTFGPEFVDALELGSKNALFDNTVVANITLWAYSYRGYQISKIIDRTSVQSNINARLWGAEGEFFWTPIDQLQLNMNVGYNGSTIGNSTFVRYAKPLSGTAWCHGRQGLAGLQLHNLQRDRSSRFCADAEHAWLCRHPGRWSGDRCSGG